MKKLNMLHILMTLGFVTSSSCMYSMDVAEAMDDVEQIEDLNDGVLNELEKTDEGRATIKQIVLDEFNLEANLDKIADLVSKISKEISRLSKKAEVSEMDTARLAVELADAKTKLEEAQARRMAKGKKKNKVEDVVTTQLNKAITALKELNDNAMTTVNKTTPKVARKTSKTAQHIKKSKTHKTAVKATDKAGQAVDYVHHTMHANKKRAADTSNESPEVTRCFMTSLPEDDEMMTESYDHM